MRRYRYIQTLLLAVLVTAGCSAMPGLRVLTGETSPDAVANQVVEISDLVMADKTGLTDPALVAAADRIEAAAPSVDVIEIRQDLSTDVFSVYMLFRPPSANPTTNDLQNALRRSVELTWQGTLTASEGSDVLFVSLLVPTEIPTLDNGPSFIGRIAMTFEIARSDALAYLNHRPNTFNDFVDLIAQGKMTMDQPQDFQIYSGTPNHPMFMLAPVTGS